MQQLLRKAVFILLLCPAALKAQEMSFSIIVSPGDSLRNAGDMIGAIDAYKKGIAGGYTFPAGDQSADRSAYLVDVYNLACAYSRAGMQDSAIKYLKRYNMEAADSMADALADPDFINIRGAAGWPELENQMVRNYCARNNIKMKDPAYAKALWLMSAKDQAYYKDINDVEQKLGRRSAAAMALWDLKRKLNEENQQQLEALIKTKGWPKLSDVGKGPAMAAFLVIQHADLGKQQKYLPVIEGLCKTGEARRQDYALMYDRIQTSTGKAQRYGSQVRYNDQSKKYELFPLEDAAKVEEWRKEAGLQPLPAYLSRWDIKWPESK